MRFRRHKKRRLVVAMADSHAGHRMGLCNPDTILCEEDGDDVQEYNPELNHTQEYLWELYQKHIKGVKELAAGDEVTLFHNGDLTQGVKYAEHLISTRMADQFEIAFWNLLPWLEQLNVTKARLIKGTASHVMGEGSSEIVVARLLSERYRARSIKSYYHGLVDVGGFEVDVSHHGPGTGIRFYLEGNVGRLYLIDRMAKALRRNQRPARVYFRAHRHFPVWETKHLPWHGEYLTSDLIVLPSYCGPGGFARRVAQSPDELVNGLAALEIVNDRLKEIHWFWDVLDLRTKETL